MNRRQLFSMCEARIFWNCFFEKLNHFSFNILASTYTYTLTRLPFGCIKMIGATFPESLLSESVLRFSGVWKNLCGFLWTRDLAFFGGL